ncbi:hypothetical protein QVD17_02253 [Tagetes erecta]|uniref:t-SNARE coiled-coil homology domain-containing protein n=1 Tax=Tagetes erecta TaxID=13708 RepID=A0AAD8P7L1_TARER|nr:hypothetical protein QVD17_02253 [Tagetes erecta]
MKIYVCFTSVLDTFNLLSYIHLIFLVMLFWKTSCNLNKVTDQFLLLLFPCLHSLTTQIKIVGLKYPHTNFLSISISISFSIDYTKSNLGSYLQRQFIRSLLTIHSLLFSSKTLFNRIISMSSAQDPFYIVKEEIQESIDKLQFSFHQWENIPANSEKHLHLKKELLESCGSIEWQVDELEKTISVASRDPARFGITEVELGKRRRWTSIARTQVGNVKKAVGSISIKSGEHRELMRMPRSQQQDTTYNYIAGENDDFISSESDRQTLLIKRQDEELDEMSESIQRIGDVGLTIHDELLAQDRIIEELGTEMESTSNRLDFVQKKVAIIMKKAGMKGQFMMILFLVILFIVLFTLVFFT